MNMSNPDSYVHVDTSLVTILENLVTEKARSLNFIYFYCIFQDDHQLSSSYHEVCPEIEFFMIQIRVRGLFDI